MYLFFCECVRARMRISFKEIRNILFEKHEIIYFSDIFEKKC